MANERLNENLISRITEIIQQQIEVRMSAHDEELRILKERMDTLAHDVRSLSLGASDMRVEHTRTRDSDSFGDNDGDIGNKKNSAKELSSFTSPHDSNADVRPRDVIISGTNDSLKHISPEKPRFDNVSDPSGKKKRRFPNRRNDTAYHGRIVNQVAASVNSPEVLDSEPEKRFARNDASHAVQKPSPTVFDAPRCADVTSAEEKERRERERFERDEATIKYEQCRTGVYKPSGFNDQDFIKSEPGSFLSIDHIHGYHNTGVHPRTMPNVFRLPGEEIIFFASSSVIVQSTRNRSQRSYEHDKEVSAIAVHPNGRFIASGDIGMTPTIHCWDATTGRPDDCREISKSALVCKLIGHEKGVLSLDFSHDGKLLVSMGGDHKYTIIIWKWEEQQKLVTASAHSAPVISIRFNPFQAYGLPDNPPKPGQALTDDDAVYTLTSGGVRHIKFWVLLRAEDPDGRPHKETGQKPTKWFIEGNYGNFNGTAGGDSGYTQDITSFDFVDDSPYLERLNSQSGEVIIVEGTSSRTTSRVVCGTRSGDLYIFKQPIIELNPDNNGKEINVTGPWWLDKRIRDARAVPEGINITKRLWDSYGYLMQSVPCSENIGNEYNAHRRETGSNGMLAQYSGPLAHQGCVTGITYHSGVRALVTCGEDGLLLLWNPHAGKRRTDVYPVKLKDGSHVELAIASIDEDDGVSPEAEALSQKDPAFVLSSFSVVPRTLTSSVYSTSILVGTSGNSIIEVDCKGGNFKKSSRIVAAHSGSILALAAHPCALYYATGGRDRVVRLWGFEERDCIADIHLHRGIQDLCFHPCGRFIVVGLAQSDFIVIEIKGGILRARAPIEGKILLVPIARRNLLPDQKGGAHADIKDNSAKRDSIMRLKISPNGKALAVGTNGRNIHIFNVNVDSDPAAYRKVTTLKGHTSVVKDLDWSSDSRFIMSNSVDGEIIYWETAPPPEKELAHFKPKQFVHPFELRDLEWDTWTCHLGWPVQGIWGASHEYSDNSEMNRVGRSNKGSNVLTGDSHYNIRLFRFPCLTGAVPKIYPRHCGPVTGVTFLYDDKHAVSIGGSDSSVIQWHHNDLDVNKPSIQDSSAARYVP